MRRSARCVTHSPTPVAPMLLRARRLHNAEEIGHDLEMTDESTKEPDSVVLRYLRSIDAQLDRLGERIDNLTARVGALEGGFAVLVGQVATMSTRLDRFEARLDRIERRLGLVESAP